MPSTHVPDLPGLRLLLAVGRTGGIGAAARAVGVSQQSASERLRAIEAQTGLTLVRRGARGSALTDAGVVVTEWASRLVDLSEEVEAAILGLRHERSRELTLWASMTVADALVPRWLVQLRARQTRAGQEPTVVGFTATNSARVEDAVRNGTAHLGFVEGTDPPAHLRSVVVAHDRLVLVVAADDPLARRTHTLDAAEIAALALTGREPGSGTREVVERALTRAGAPAPTAVIEFSTTTAVRESVLAGSGPAFLSRRVVRRDVDAGLLAVVPTDLDLDRDFRAVWTGGPHPPAGPARDLVAVAAGRSPRVRPLPS